MCGVVIKLLSLLIQCHSLILLISLLYRQENGHTRVPKRLPHLGPWVKTQRSNLRQGKLSDDKHQKLLAIDFDWDPLNKYGGYDAIIAAIPSSNSTPTTTDVSIFTSDVWKSCYEELKKYYQTNGNVNVLPPGYSDGIGGCLFTWLETQKRFHKQDILPPQQANMLEGLGVNLTEIGTENGLARNDIAWNINFNALKEYHEQHGNTDVPFEYKKDLGYGGYKDLAKWCQKQREFYKKKKLPDDRVQKLLSLGMNLTAAKTPVVKKSRKKFSLGSFPEDNIFFEHEDGQSRRVPSSWVFPRLSLEGMYILYHCGSHVEGNPNQKLSPMKIFEPSDMVNKKRDKTNLGEVRNICSIIDVECQKKGEVIDRCMTEEDAKRCVRIGYTALNIPFKSEAEVLGMKWSRVCSEKRTIPLEKERQQLQLRQGYELGTVGP